ncbi:syntaxin, Qa-SNARE family, putative [Plasmodium vivax]|uniref:t-SNARE coiled-coil homology domain-containing protein n=6 Tax=Plasmodium vivax TaxID=5855 RepID=A5K2X1_PLAVS|nr:hypothetical protein, conserved [Plasmodium vivax]KMZ79115.1 hypothetical protein PVIIG_05092 [Plasmodium vivax India VII]KMZ85534.1 hypothetical protein PVBG_02220 [Plasmodium vivax Brazil I]KMZ91409.1 hypothetical protein PVMG_00283 [Plasmodium vivax Mauritania I]KMZ98263.1 hypothetical protein PVNG_04873 [Plasmodium vivax North Korean]EDL45875.1 hypothetical protein, conserved [Plasmodium vivax]|eukprot:XP_001615602.1 hypothetical protein [Plasmodium vivax Sal-1]
MDRSDEFARLCRKRDKGVALTRREIKCKDEFLIQSSKIYTNLLANCDYVDNNTLRQYNLTVPRSIHVKEKKTRVKSKGNLLYAVNKISEDIDLLKLKTKTETHKQVLLCLNNLLGIFIDIINKYEHNLSSYHLKLSQYTNFCFYDVKGIKCNVDYLNRLNRYIYATGSCDGHFRKPGALLGPTNGGGASQHDVAHTSYHHFGSSIKSYSTGEFPKGENPLGHQAEKEKREKYLLEEGSKQQTMPKEDPMKNAPLRKRRDKRVQFDTYNYVEEEEAEKGKGEFFPPQSSSDNYLLGSNQQLEFKKYVDLFEKEENTYIMETKNKIAKISKLMNIFVTKIYEQNENLSMIEHVVEESIENVAQGNTYLSKMQNKKSMNSLIFFVLVCTSLFLLIFDMFR